MTIRLNIACTFYTAVQWGGEAKFHWRHSRDRMARAIMRRHLSRMSRFMYLLHIPNKHKQRS
jgi:hypothetical protein